jgi:hypothetical protein
VAQSLDLPVQETPVYGDLNFNDWVNVQSYPGGASCYLQCDTPSDNTAAIQAAIDSGHTTVYLPPGAYGLSGTIHIRGNVIQFLGIGPGVWIVPMPGFPAGKPAIEIDRTSSRQVFFDSINLGANYSLPTYLNFPQPSLLNNSPGTLVILDSSVAYQNTAAAIGGTVFIENLFSSTSQWFNHVTVFARNLDPENWDTNPHVHVSGGSLWTLGLKIEGNLSPVLQVDAGGSAEVLGLAASIWNYVEGFPMLLNEMSSISVSAYRTNPFMYPSGPTDYQKIAEELLGRERAYLYGASTGVDLSAHPYCAGSAGSLFVGEMQAYQ